MSTGLSSWPTQQHSILDYISLFRVFFAWSWWFHHLLQAVQSMLTPCCNSAHHCCSVDSQGQSNAQRIASQVQSSAFLTSQSNALDELVNMACLLVDTINEMSGAPVHLSPLSSTDHTYLSLAGLHNYLFWAGWKVLKIHYRLEFVNPNQQAIYPIHIKGWQTISGAREDMWYCLKVLMSLAVVFKSKILRCWSIIPSVLSTS